MALKQSTVSGPLSLREKSYVVTVEYKGGWPAIVSYHYHYHGLSEAMKHLDWLGGQMKSQNGNTAQRKNVVLGFFLREYLRSKKLEKALAPIARFVRPKGREKPAGGELSVNVEI